VAKPTKSALLAPKNCNFELLPRTPGHRIVPRRDGPVRVRFTGRQTGLVPGMRVSGLRHKHAQEQNANRNPDRHPRNCGHFPQRDFHRFPLCPIILPEFRPRVHRVRAARFLLPNTAEPDFRATAPLLNQPINLPPLCRAQTGNRKIPHKRPKYPAPVT